MSENENAGATARPWAIWGDEGDFLGIESVGKGKENRISVVLWGDHDDCGGVRGSTVAEAHANARLICTAVNEHAALVRVAEAAEAVRYHERSTVSAPGMRHHYLAAVNELDHALLALDALRAGKGAV